MRKRKELINLKFVNFRNSIENPTHILTSDNNNAGYTPVEALISAASGNYGIVPSGSGFMGGDLTGNTRGNKAMDIQSGRAAATQIASGDYSSAFGYNNNVGNRSSAFGYDNTANGDNSSAFGYGNNATGTLSHAIGNNNIADTDRALAFGCFNQATGTSAAAFGYNNSSTGVRSLVVGSSSAASGNRAAAFGYDCAAEAINSVVVGRSLFTHTTGLASCNFGILNNSTGGTLDPNTGDIVGTISALTTQGRLTTAIGIRNSTLGNFASAVGYTNTASGDNSSAFGYTNTASGVNSSAFGSFNTASGLGVSSAFGYNNTASENNSSAFGYGNTASGINSSAFGCSNIISGWNSSAFGILNVVSGDNSFAVGYGINSNKVETFEAGYWSSSVRRGSIRLDNTGLAQFTIRSNASAPVDGGVTAGGEDAGELGRGMMAFSRNGLALAVYYNDAGTVKSIPMGTFDTDGLRKRTISVTLDGGGAVLASGLKTFLPEIPYACTINSWRLISDVTGSVTLDIWKAASAIPTISDTITAAAKPALSAARLGKSSTLTGWTTTVAENDVFIINVDSATTITKLTLVLDVRIV